MTTTPDPNHSIFVLHRNSRMGCSLKRRAVFLKLSLLRVQCIAARKPACLALDHQQPKAYQRPARPKRTRGSHERGKAKELGLIILFKDCWLESCMQADAYLLWPWRSPVPVRVALRTRTHPHKVDSNLLLCLCMLRPT